jgi:Uma2 family endonuclease
MSPSVNHSYIQAKLTALLDSYEQYSVFTELSIEIEGKEYVPDISVYPARKFTPLQDEIRTKEIPVLIVEVLSPTQNTQELIDKFQIYLKVNVTSCWLVIPMACSIVVCHDLKKPIYSQNQVIDEKLNITLPMSKIFPR